MKRCPLCDFIYEDDQVLCDMDGIELIQDGGALVPADAVAVSSPRRKLSVLPLVAAVCGAAVFWLYYASTDGAAPASAGHSPAPASVQVPAATPTPSSPKLPANDAEEADQVTRPTRPSSPRPRATRPKSVKTRPERGDRKKESKLGALLNKTGSILKKPFKF